MDICMMVAKERFVLWMEEQSGRFKMKKQNWFQRDLIKNYFPVPNKVFVLSLSSGELAVYCYLLFCENRTTYQCWPSFQTIAKATCMSRSTVSKYVRSLEAHRFITTEQTSVITKVGQKRNGNLRYTIRPIQEVLEQFYADQMAHIEKSAQLQKTEKGLKVR